MKDCQTGLNRSGKEELMKQEQNLKTISMKVSPIAWERFSKGAEDRKISKRQAFDDLVYRDYYISRQEVTMSMVNLMDGIGGLEGNCDRALYMRLKEEGERLCRLLSIN